MKKIVFVFLLLSTYIFSNINSVVSILPEQTFVKAIGGDKVNVSVIVQPGNSPHMYEPKPSQMIDIAKAHLYFAIDVEFEHAWLPKFHNQNPKMQIIDLTENITKIEMNEQHEDETGDIHHEEHKEHEHDAHNHKGKDPHIWTAPANVKIIARNIYHALKKTDPENADYYKKNLDIFLASIDETDRQIIHYLSTLEGIRSFMVFHPSWGYFAKAYDLEQIAVEIEGKEPKPKELILLLKEGKEKKVKAIFTQPEFSDTVAKIIAKELQIPVVKATSLDPDWSENLINMAKAIAGQE